MNFNESLNTIVQYYTGPKLCISTTGVGMSLTKILSIPGYKRILHSINHYTSQECIDKEFENIQTYHHDVLSKEVAAMLSIRSTIKYGAEFNHIGITGRLSSSVWDKDASEAFIALNDNLYHLKLNTLDLEAFFNKEIWEAEDMAVSQMVLSLMTNNIEKPPFLGTGFIKKINLIN